MSTRWWNILEIRGWILIFILAERNSQDLGVIFFWEKCVCFHQFSGKTPGRSWNYPKLRNFSLIQLCVFSLRLRNCENEICSTRKKCPTAAVGASSQSLSQTLQVGGSLFVSWEGFSCIKLSFFSQTWCTSLKQSPPPSPKLWGGKVKNICFWFCRAMIYEAHLWSPEGGLLES